MKKSSTKRRGQVMLLAILTITGTILGATTIAGLLTLYQIRQAGDFARSAQAIFASDAGIEWGLYQFFKPTSASITAPVFGNGAVATAICFDAILDPDLTTPITCTDASTTIVRSTGASHGANRVLELTLASP